MSEYEKAKAPQKNDTVSDSNQSTKTPSMVGSNPASIIQRAQMYPESLTPAEVIQLQRSVGNQAVLQLLKAGAKNSSPVIQAKMIVGASNNEYEQEADQVAERVMRMPETSLQQAVEDKDAFHVKPMIQRKGEGSFETDEAFESRLNSSKGGGASLPDNLQKEFGSKIGADFSSIKIHTGKDSENLNQQIQAKAFTHGNNIFFNSGQYSPNSSEGKHLLAHELTHTIQQGASAIDAKADSLAPSIQRAPLKPGDAAPTIAQASVGRMSAKTRGGNYEERAKEGLVAKWRNVDIPQKKVDTHSDLQMTTAPATDIALIWTVISIIEPLDTNYISGLDYAIEMMYNLHPAIVGNLGLNKANAKVRVEAAINQELVNQRIIIYNTIPDLEIRAAALANTAIPFSSDVASVAFLNGKDVDNLDEPTLQQKTTWSGQLKKMPTIEQLLSGELFEEGNMGPIDVKWGTPSVLYYDEKNDKDGLAVDDIHPIHQRIVEARRRLKFLVDGAVLNQIDFPLIRVHDRDNFRAYYSSAKKAIHIARNDDVETIIHEFGHHMESNLDSSLWLGVQRLLHGRHEDKVQTEFSPKNTLTNIGATIFSSMRSEPRYKAQMPATGAYSAKAYDSGDTEVVSMSMQFLAAPATAKTLIEKDPQQAAIILKKIKPVEYAENVSQDFDAFLPY